MMSNVERDRAVDLGISYIFVNKMIMSVLPFANHNNNNIIICTYLLGDCSWKSIIFRVVRTSYPTKIYASRS